MGKDLLAGVSVAGNRCQLVVFETRGSGMKLVYLQDFARTGPHELWFLDAILNPREKLLKKIAQVSVAIDTSSVALHWFPLDTSLTQTEQNEHTNWELEHFIPEFQPGKYIWDQHVMRTRARDQIADVLVVAVKSAVVRTIQEALLDKEIELHLVDTTYFGAEHALLLNYPEIRSATVGLLSGGGRRIDAGVVSNGRLVKYALVPETSQPWIPVLQDLLRDSSVAEIYCCGTIALDEANRLQEEFDVDLKFLDPFRRSADISGCKSVEGYHGFEQLFAASTGLALKRV